MTSFLSTLLRLDFLICWLYTFRAQSLLCANLTKGLFTNGRWRSHSLNTDMYFEWIVYHILLHLFFYSNDFINWMLFENYASFMFVTPVIYLTTSALNIFKNSLLTSKPLSVSVSSSVLIDIYCPLHHSNYSSWKSQATRNFIHLFDMMVRSSYIYLIWWFKLFEFLRYTPSPISISKS